MTRMHIPISKDLKMQLELRAKREKKSIAELAREILSENMKKNRPNAGEVLLKLADKAAKEGPSDLSTNIDKYLYEDE